ncbi:hypothetical protein [Aquisediminimonas sediminicola]|nr:hypothetical protein [Aquisediminimonas sediminicola]
MNVPELVVGLVHSACIDASFAACQLGFAKSFTATLYKFAPLYVG